MICHQCTDADLTAALARAEQAEAEVARLRGARESALREAAALADALAKKED